MIYVDKSDMIASIVNSPNVGFSLFRPRRFGKTLLLNTFKDLFTNGLKNFQGLKIQTQNLYDDSKTYPVLHIDFSKFKEVNNIIEFKDFFCDTLKEFSYKNQIELKRDIKNPVSIADEIFQSFDTKTLVLLIDEYDAPLNNSMLEPELFEDIRKTYSNFLSTVKSNEGRFRFIFMTGITRYTHASIFSPFNIIKDLSLDTRFQNLLGYTEDELTEYFTPYLEKSAKELNISIDELHSKLKEYYDGYHFNPDLKCNMYCPFSILNFFDNPSNGFANYWNESGAGTTVVNNYFKKNPISCSQILDGFEMSSDDYNQGIDISHVNYAVILHQAGYYTFSKGTDGFDYIFRVPNKEVSNIIYPIVFENDTGLNKATVNELIRNTRKLTKSLFDKNENEALTYFKNALNFYGYDAFNALIKDERVLRDNLCALFKSTLYHEAYNNVYTVYREEMTTDGRADISIEYQHKEKVVLELKVAKDSNEAQRKLLDAIEQIKSHDYGNDGFINKDGE